MALYTVHLPIIANTRAQALERAVFVREGWSWGALVFGPFWVLWHRHYLVGALTLIASMLFTAALGALSLHPLAVVTAQALVAILFALEGASLRRLALKLRGAREVALVVGQSMDEAERRFYANASTAPLPPPPLPPTPAGVPQGPGGVIGLFPQAGRA